MRDFEKTKTAGSDFDDTVTSNSMEIYISLYLKRFGSLGFNVEEADFREIITPVWGQSSQDVIGHVVGQYSLAEGVQHELDPAEIMTAVAEYEEELRSGVFVERVELVPGAIETFERVRGRGVHIGIATGLPRELLDEVLKDNGVPEDLFVGKISAYDIKKTERKKPHPLSLQMIRQASAVARGAEVLTREMVYVGDSANDIRMAQAMPGVESVAVLTGNLTREQAVALGVSELNILENVCHIEEVLERREKTF